MGDRVKIRRSKRNPDFFEVTGGYGQMGSLQKGYGPVRTMDLTTAMEVASARVRVGKKRKGEIPFQTYPDVTSEIDVEI